MVLVVVVVVRDVYGSSGSDGLDDVGWCSLK